MNVLKTIGNFAAILGREFIKFPSYLTAVFIGLLINYLTTANPLDSAVPFLVSLLVQNFSKAGLRFRNRFNDLLLMLPGERQDPAFVTDCSGRIIAATGKSLDFLKDNQIEKIEDLFPAFSIHSYMEEITETKEPLSLEMYSLIVKKWYQTKVICNLKERTLLIWLEDISDRKEQEEKLIRLRQFSRETTASIKELVITRDTFDRVALFILNEDFEAAFIARESESEILSGFVFKLDGTRLIKSARINVPRSLKAPVWDSHNRSRISLAEKKPGQDQKEFELKHPFHQDVKDFIRNPIVNYVNYHEGDVSLIAFNKRTGMSSFNGSLIETLVNSARSITYLTDLAIANDERFVQSIHGLCAAAEYSDEQTGKHILRVNEYSRMVSKKLGCTKDFQDAIGEVAAIHDIGKVAMPEIIKLPRLLTPEERLKIEMHTVYGSKILQQMIDIASIPDPRMVMAKSIALHHHQSWNGKGYPALLNPDGTAASLLNENFNQDEKLRPPAEKEIPLEALIVSLADNYDALRSARHYKPGFSHAKTVSIIEKDDRSGSTGEDRFGPELFDVFCQTSDEFNRIYSSML